MSDRIQLCSIVTSTLRDKLTSGLRTSQKQSSTLRLRTHNRWRSDASTSRSASVNRPDRRCASCDIPEEKGKKEPVLELVVSPTPERAKKAMPRKPLTRPLTGSFLSYLLKKHRNSRRTANSSPTYELFPSHQRDVDSPAIAQRSLELTTFCVQSKTMKVRGQRTVIQRRRIHVVPIAQCGQVRIETVLPSIRADP